MDEVIILKAGGQRRADILLQVDLDMVGLSFFYWGGFWRNFWHGGVFLSMYDWLDTFLRRITIGQPKL